MAIRASSANHIDALVADLASDRAVARDAAIARLTVIGARATQRLTALAVDCRAASPARIAALGVLEATADPAGLDAALRAAGDDEPPVAVAAIGAVRVHIRGGRSAAVLDRLTAIALNHKRPAPVRAAAIHCLTGLERATVRPLVETLRGDPVPEIAALAAGSGHAAPPEDDPEALRHKVAHEAKSFSLFELVETIERTRHREIAANPADRTRWMSARAAAHLALARRGSRLALYDIRETLESAKEPLPVEYLAALGEIGDASCLESIAAAYAASRCPRDDWWHHHLADAFRAIVSRERITRRHAAVKKVEKRWPTALQELWAGKAGGAGKAGR